MRNRLRALINDLGPIPTQITDPLITDVNSARIAILQVAKNKRVRTVIANGVIFAWIEDDGVGRPQVE